jgi:hypothetical protein
MAANTIPKQFDAKCALAEDIADGLHDLQGPLGVKQNKEADVRGDTADAQAAENDYQVKRQLKIQAVAAQTLADGNAQAFIATAKNVLIPYLGRDWSQIWATAGFINGSTAIPTRMDERQTCLASLKLYFTNNPAHENPPLNVTAAQAELLFQDLSDKRSAVNSATTAMGQARDVRDIAIKKLDKRLSGTLHELDQLLAPDDQRWYAFGLKRPVDQEVPPTPRDLVVIAANAGHLLASWDHTPYAERYRVWRQIVDVDPDFQPILTVTDTDATLNTLASGTAIRVYVTALNDAGESQPSEIVEAVVP